MSGLSVQLDRLSVGTTGLGVSQIYPSHKEETEKYLTKIFQSHLPSAPNQKIPLKLKLSSEKPTLLVGEKEISLTKSDELKGVNRIVRYYQHTDLLPRIPFASAKEIDRAEKMKKSVQLVNESSIPGTKGTILAGMRLADDSLSLSRDILRVLPMFGPNSAIVNHLGYYAGVFWSFLAFRELDGGITEYKRAKLIGDAEGTRRATSRLCSGSIVSGGMLAYLGGKACETFATAASASALLSASNVLFGIGSVVAMGTSLLGAVRCRDFSQRLNEYLGNPKLSERQRMCGAIQFLKDSISVTPEERAEIEAEIEKKYPDWSKEKKEKLLLQKLTDLTEVKVKHVKRRTSNRSLRLIADHADKILAKLNSPEHVLEGMRGAMVLIDAVQKENKVKMGLHILTFVAGVIGFIAMLILTFASAGIAPFILYGIAGTIYLGVTIYTIAGTGRFREKFVDI